MTTLFIGLSTLDIQYFVDKFPGSNVKVKTSEPNLLVGGPATNAAVANAFLGGNSVLLSGVGQNRFRDFFLDDFDFCNINHIDLYGESKQIPVLASVITSMENGDRNIFTYNPEFKNAPFDAKALLNKFKPDQIMIDGFYPEIAIPFLQEASTNKIPVIFDGGSWKPHLDKMLDFVDYAICSDNFFPPNCQSPEIIFKYLKSKKIRYSAITQGRRPVLFQNEVDSGKIIIPQIKAIDTLGAGDFFHGAFCYYILHEKSFHKALSKATLLASKTCEFAGTRDWLNKLEQKAFL